MRDLSDLAKDSMWITSQEGGNMVHDNTGAWSAPGSEPVTPMPPAERQPDPAVTFSGDELPVGTPPRRGEQSYTPSPVKWGPADQDTPDPQTVWWREPYTAKGILRWLTHLTRSRRLRRGISSRTTRPRPRAACRGGRSRAAGRVTCRRGS